MIVFLSDKTDQTTDHGYLTIIVVENSNLPVVIGTLLTHEEVLVNRTTVRVSITVVSLGERFAFIANMIVCT